MDFQQCVRAELKEMASVFEPKIGDNSLKYIKVLQANALVRLPGKFWVDSCSVFIVEVQRGSLVVESSSHNTDRLHNVTNHSLLVCLE